MRDLPGGLAEIHGAACPNVDAKCINVRSKVTIKGKSALARAGVMGWRGHGDALSPSQILKQTAQIRILSVFWMFEMQNCKHCARELCCSCGRFFFCIVSIKPMVLSRSASSKCRVRLPSRLQTVRKDDEGGRTSNKGFNVRGGFVVGDGAEDFGESSKICCFDFMSGDRPG